MIDSSIFKAYDIRGKYPETIDEDLAYKIGRAYAELLFRENPSKKLEIVVGNDMRLSSPQLKEKAIQGLVDSGINVIDIGLATTPTFYFAVAYYGYDGGMQVSASHNPKEWNGFKMTRKRAVPISGDTGINDIRDMVIKGEFGEVKEKGIISKKEGVLLDEVKIELNEWKVDISKIKPLKIVIDAANAMGSLDVEEMFSGLSCELIKLNFELDGSFPVHEADPMKEENLKYLQDAVLEHKADLGISIDGDADRYFFVDEKGEIVRQDILRGIMAQLALLEYPGETVCYDIRPGRITKDMIEEAGGKAFVTRVGHSLIKEAMIKNNAVFGGESSGHYFYKFSFGTFEAPIILTLRFLQFISEKNQKVSELVAPYKKYFHSGEINFKVTSSADKIKEIAEKYKDADEISHLDGITVTYSDWWFNARGSNTETTILRLTVEAKSKELMEKKRDELSNFIKI
jgi:phosphomannomutase